MTNKSPMIQIDVPEHVPITEYRRETIKWCQDHWSELMYALQDRGLGDEIAQSDEVLNAKLAEGKGDPCWDAFSAVNVGAMQIFGPAKIVEEYGGCPACAFKNVVQHAADLVTPKYRSPH